jgi:hypothetical protein
MEHIGEILAILVKTVGLDGHGAYRGRFQALPDFLSSESGTGSTQPSECN